MDHRFFADWCAQYVTQNGFTQPEWVKAGVTWRHLTLYCRASTIERGAVELANMSSRKKGSGALRQFLDHYEPRIPFIFESILNVRLARSLLDRGYLLYQNKQTVPTLIDYGFSPLVQDQHPHIIEGYTARNGGYNVITSIDDLLTQVEAYCAAA